MELPFLDFLSNVLSISPHGITTPFFQIGPIGFQYSRFDCTPHPNGIGNDGSSTTLFVPWSYSSLHHRKHISSWLSVYILDVSQMFGPTISAVSNGPSVAGSKGLRMTECLRA